MKQPLVSVVTLTWNHSHLLKTFLRAFEAQVSPDWLQRTELIIVDNGSADDTQRVLREWKARPDGVRWKCTFSNPVNVGFAAGNNRAIREANGEYLLLLNNDVVFKSNLVRACVRAYRPGTLLGARLIARPTPWNQLNGGFVRYLEGWCLFASATTFREIGIWQDGAFLGVFDERFSPAFFEDMDLSLGAHLKGVPLKAARLPVRHLESCTTKGTVSFPFMDVMYQNRKRFQEKWGHLRAEDLDPARLRTVPITTPDPPAAPPADQ